MDNVEFSISRDLFAQFPELILGLIHIQGIDNSTAASGISALLHSEEERIKVAYKTETLSKLPRIKSWRSAYSAFGAKPKKYKSSVESLYRMVLKGIELRSINPLVDIYNYISLKYMVPLGGDDLDRTEGDIELGYASGEESFIPLNAIEMEQVKEKEVIYRDAKGVLCRRWNWRECDRTKLTPQTRNAVLVAEALPPVGRQEITEISQILSTLVQQYCGGKHNIYLLDKGNQVVRL